MFYNKHNTLYKVCIFERGVSKSSCLSFCVSQITKIICNLSSDNAIILQPQSSSLSGGKDRLDAQELFPWAGLLVGFALCNVLLTAHTSSCADVRVLFPQQPPPNSIIIFERLSTIFKDKYFNILQLFLECFHD